MFSRSMRKNGRSSDASTGGLLSLMSGLSNANNGGALSFQSGNGGVDGGAASLIGGTGGLGVVDQSVSHLVH